jgi:hypothetical protein
MYAQPFYVLRKTKFYAAVKKGVCAPSYVIPKLCLNLQSNLWKGCLNLKVILYNLSNLKINISIRTNITQFFKAKHRFFVSKHLPLCFYSNINSVYVF